MIKSTKRKILFHGPFKEKYTEELIIRADSLQNLFSILFKEVFPDLLRDEKFTVVFEDDDGNFTEIFDPEQQLSSKQKTIHIMPNPDGAYIQIVYAVIVAIVAIGVALLLAPKVEAGSNTASGYNWENPENVVGQGGTLPVVLGTTLAGSRVASYGIDSLLYTGRSS